MPTDTPPAARAAHSPPAGPGALWITWLFLLLTLAVGGCAAVGTVAKHAPTDEAVRSAQAAADAARLSAAQARAAHEPRYLRFKADETQLTGAWDDGRHTYLQFNDPATADLEFFNEEGRPLDSGSAGNVAAVQGLHAGILVRNKDRASFVSPNPRAVSLPRAPLPAGADFTEARATLENQTGQLQAMRRAMEAARRSGATRPPAPPLQPWLPTSQPAAAQQQAYPPHLPHLPHLPHPPQTGATQWRQRPPLLRPLQHDDALQPGPGAPGAQWPGRALAPLAAANASASAPEHGLVRVFFATASRAIVAPDDGLGLLLREAAKADEIRVTGFTDATGSREANAALALARADAVVQILLRRGIAAARIITRAVGADEYIADNASDRGRALNRRAEVVLLKNGEPLALGLP